MEVSLVCSTEHTVGAVGSERATSHDPQRSAEAYLECSKQDRIGIREARVPRSYLVNWNYWRLLVIKKR
jgi:hypothetical protein